jgi:hypothetical protein
VKKQPTFWNSPQAAPRSEVASRRCLRCAKTVALPNSKL